MKGSLKKTLKIVLPMALGVFFVLYWYANTTVADREQIVGHIQNVDLLWVGLSVGIGILSHVSRALRWNCLLNPMGYRVGTANGIMIIFLSYFANTLIIRSGEVLRATALATYEDVPFEKGLGTIVTERVIDLIMLLLVILVAFLLQAPVIWSILDEYGIGLVGSAVLLSVGIGGAFVAYKLVKRSKAPIAIKIKALLSGMLDGITSIFRMKDKWTFVFHTLFIWAAYVGMFWVIKYTVPATTDLSFGQILVAFVAGAFAMATTNGGLGLFPVVVGQALLAFGVDSVSGDAYGWIMWIAQTMMVVVLGAISFLLLPLWNKIRA